MSDIVISSVSTALYTSSCFFRLETSAVSDSIFTSMRPRSWAKLDSGFNIKQKIEFQIRFPSQNSIKEVCSVHLKVRNTEITINKSAAFTLFTWYIN